MERSVKFCVASVLFGMANVAVYWIAVFLDKAPGTEVAVAGVAEIIAPVIGYFIYQAKLKDSRNKYGIDKDGVPYAVKQSEDNASEPAG